MNKYIELDYVGLLIGPRLTHYPSGETCMRQPWMSNQKWMEVKTEFLSKYPNEIIFIRGNEIERNRLIS